jgi:hypothetical protein
LHEAEIKIVAEGLNPGLISADCRSPVFEIERLALLKLLLSEDALANSGFWGGRAGLLSSEGSPRLLAVFLTIFGAKGLDDNW